MRRAEVWWGSASLAGPRRKTRPFLIVSDDAFNQHTAYPKVLVVHLTSTRRSGGPYDWEVDVPRGAGGLPRGSVAKCAEIYTVFKEQLVERLGTLPQTTMDRVDRALALSLGLDLRMPAND
jgi:mRNA interferase MazF